MCTYTKISGNKVEMIAIKRKYIPVLMWLFPLIFFAFQFILRLWQGLMMNPIMEQFSINASEFGILAAFYYYGYAIMQIPVAILLDRFKPRYVLFIFALICGMATLLFTLTSNFYLALLSRFLIGAGSAAGFLGVSKVISEWFPKEQYGRMIGLTFTFGLMGAIFGGKPMGLLIKEFSWQNVSVTLAVLSIAIGCIAYLFLRSPKNENSENQDRVDMKSFISILTSPIILGLGLCNLLLVGSLEGFADVWGIPYLVSAYDIPKEDAAGFVSLVFFGMLLGGPIIAFLSKKIGNYKTIILSGCGMGCAFIMLFLCTSYHPLLLSILFFGIGILCCYQVSIFSAGASLVSPQQLGITIAFLNCVNMLGGSFFHTIIGKGVEIFSGEEFNPLNHQEIYTYALSIVPLCAFLGALLIFFIGIRARKRRTPFNKEAKEIR
jgi:predicted MFS family arabinose efflux permease